MCLHDSVRSMHSLGANRHQLANPVFSLSTHGGHVSGKIEAMISYDFLLKNVETYAC